MADLGGIETDLVGRLEGDDLPISDGGGKLGRERRDSAALRRVGGDERGARDAVKSSRRARSPEP
jgi:hypothetical protein